MAEIEIIDVKSENDIEGSWVSFIKGEHYYITDSFNDSFITNYPRRSCEALAFATLQNDPMRERPCLETENLVELQQQVMPLIKEELEWKKVKHNLFEDWLKVSAE